MKTPHITKYTSLNEQDFQKDKKLKELCFIVTAITSYVLYIVIYRGFLAQVHVCQLSYNIHLRKIVME